jgi:hypothetical protein
MLKSPSNNGFTILLIKSCKMPFPLFYFFSFLFFVVIFVCSFHFSLQFCYADLGSSFWGMVFILASTNILTTRIAAGLFILALFIVLFIAKNVSSIFFFYNLTCNLIE